MSTMKRNEETSTCETVLRLLLKESKNLIEKRKKDFDIKLEVLRSEGKQDELEGEALKQNLARLQTQKDLLKKKFNMIDSNDRSDCKKKELEIENLKKSNAMLTDELDKINSHSEPQMSQQRFTSLMQSIEEMEKQIKMIELQSDALKKSKSRLIGSKQTRPVKKTKQKRKEIVVPDDAFDSSSVLKKMIENLDSQDDKFKQEYENIAKEIDEIPKLF